MFLVYAFYCRSCIGNLQQFRGHASSLLYSKVQLCFAREFSSEGDDCEYWPFILLMLPNEKFAPQHLGCCEGLYLYTS